MTTFVPVVDISRNQGPTDFVKMKAAGVRGLILRVGHGPTVDDHFAGYYQAALAAEFAPTDVTFYSFINPKRGTGAQCAVAMLDEIHRVVGHLDVGYMADCEWYAGQSPNVGQAPVFGQSYAAWLREHRATVELEAPAVRQFGYTDLAFWNGAIVKGSPYVWCGDDQLAAEIDWIVPRYPAYSDADYVRLGYPPAPDGWAEWAFRAQQQGPLPPRGGKWLGWQPSAGWNRQGDRYGVTSRDIDIDIVHPDAWARWTGTTVQPPDPIHQPLLEDDMIIRLIAPSDSPARFYAGCTSAGSFTSCRWTGDGGDAKVQARLAAVKAAHDREHPDVPFERTDLAVADLVNVDLDGLLPPGFSADQFANTVEINARISPAPGSVDQPARDGVAAVSAAVEQIRTVLHGA